MPDNPFAKISPELWLLLASASGDTAKTQKMLQQSINWDLLLQLSIHHRVYPLVYKTLSQLNHPTVPVHVLDLLRQKYKENAIQALNMTGETVRMVKSFENHGICAVVLKGVPLAWRLYSDIAIRPSKDIDILLQPDDLEKAHTILVNKGYQRIDPEYILTPRKLQIYLKFNHHLGYWHSDKNIYLELHWKLGHTGLELPLPTETTIKRIVVTGCPIPVLSDKELLLYLISHGANHVWFRLRWLVDIGKFMQLVGIDWEKTAFLAKDFGIQHVLHQSLILVNRLFTVPIPTNIKPSLEKDRRAWQLAHMTIPFITSADYDPHNTKRNWLYYRQRYYELQVQTGWKNKFNYVLHRLGPVEDDIKLISFPDRLYALYFFLRPFTFLGRRLRILRTGN